MINGNLCLQPSQLFETNIHVHVWMGKSGINNEMESKLTSKQINQ